jgi:small GTP-binding protein
MTMFDVLFKIVIFGDAGCGKTTLRKRFMTDVFISNSGKTIGVDFDTKVLKMDGLVIKLMIWDFAGEERFRFMLPEYIYGAMGGILMYDITNYSSFTHIADWLSVINGTTQRFPILLLGAKSDLDDYREITYREGKRAAKMMDLKEFFECSSKTGENIKKTFNILTRIMLNGNGIKKTEILVR